MKIVVILGLPLSGKTTHAKSVNEQLDIEIPLVETGTFVYKAVEERGLEAIPENIVKVARECKDQSDSYFTERAYEYVEENFDTEIVFFSGVKARSEYEYLKSAAGDENVFLVSFHASPKTRHGRLLNEDRQATSKGGKGVEDKAMAEDIERFNLRDKKELGYGLGDLMALADFVVNTENERWPYKEFDTTLGDFKKIVTEIIE